MASLYHPVAPESQPELRSSRPGPAWPPALLGALAAFALMWGVQKSPAPAPPPPVPAAAAPTPAPPALANAMPEVLPELTPPRPPVPPRSRVMEVTLGQAWLCYSQGNIQGARRLALVSLEATRHSQATPEQVAQASALIELCRQAEKSRPAEVAVVPDIAVPARVAPAPAPVELPQPDYPVASSSRGYRPQHARYSAPQVQTYPQAQVYPQSQAFWPAPGAQSVSVSYIPDPMANWPQTMIPGWQPGYTPPGGQTIPYPPGRGPGVCPNYAVQDECACHQWEARQRSGQSRSRQPVSNMTRMRQAESLLGRGGGF